MKKTVILFLIITLFNIQQVFAMSAIDAGSVNSSAVRDMRLHDALLRSKEKSAIVKKEEQKSAQEKENQLNEAALTDIKNISFVNNYSIPAGELYRVIQSHINQPMNAQNISEVRKELMKYYQQKGYYSALVLVSSENAQTGELVLDIKEGGKNSITIESSL